MNFEVSEQKSWIEDYEQAIENHKETLDYAHPYSFMVILDDVLVTVNDYSEASFNKRLTACLRNDWYPFSIFHKKKHLAPLDHVIFLNEFSSNMNRRGRTPALHLDSRDLRSRIDTVS